ncbi:MAG: NAD(+)/NADH kinase [Acidobacteriota bacterium]|nr:NAD(+)/NADH kinase [Blastocatellia bacterium]MDW8412957.1 NAD(+)/NADH kinase [Acidobacteriota bacterium]
MKQVAIFGGSFNPPGINHKRIAEELAKYFDEVIVVPCGPRPDKPTTNEIAPHHRAAMVDLTFQSIDRVRVELFDLEQSSFTRTHKLQEIFADRGQIWHVVGSDLVCNGRNKKSFIHLVWELSDYIWENFNFVVIKRKDFDFTPEDLPPHSRLLDLSIEGSSSQIRERLAKRLDINDLVTPEVAAYIARYDLYSNRIPNRTKFLTLDRPRLLILTDKQNPKAQALSSNFEKYIDERNPNAILVVGGDGAMLRAIRNYWRRRLPFIGINAGTLGFLLNDLDSSDLLTQQPFILQQMPMLYVKLECEDGSIKNTLAFNDAWLERATGQTAWIEIKINGQTKIQQLIADGALISTPAGSTAYARAMGAQPLPIDSQALLLVGSNVLFPPNWKYALLAPGAEVEFKNIDAKKRPVKAYVDGELQEQVTAMRVRVSRIATVELAFCQKHDMTEKLSMIQFPK